MFLLAKPPTLRWAGAVALVLVALWADLRPPQTVMHPFLIEDALAGEVVTESDVRMVAVPPGVFEPVDLPTTVARPVAAGDPLLASSRTPDRVAVPPEWLVVELAVPDGTRPGSDVVAIVSSPDPGVPTSHRGIVTSVTHDGTFGGVQASCAFSPADAAVVAVAVAESRISVLVGS